MDKMSDRIFVYRPNKPIPIPIVPPPLITKPRKAENAKVKPIGVKVKKDTTQDL